MHNFDHLNTTAERDQLATVQHFPCEVVQVLPGYRGGGAFVADGSEGLYVVMRQLGSTSDYYLIRLRGEEAEHNMHNRPWLESVVATGAWDYIVHASRFVKLTTIGSRGAMRPCLIRRLVGFEFDLERVSLSAPRQTRRGRGIVISDQEYSVWPAPGYAIRVTDSPDYPAGEVVYCCSTSLRP
jgi:hypothetical protein